jgi:hypothetical protein
MKSEEVIYFFVFIFRKHLNLNLQKVNLTLY